MPFIAGATPYCGWESTLALFKLGGYSISKSSSLEGWYSTLPVKFKDSDKFSTANGISRIIEQDKVAAKLVVTVTEPSVLGKENHINEQFLDFGVKDFKKMQFVLFHCRPEIAIAEARKQGVNSAEILKNWQESAQQMLAFYRRNRRKAWLIDTSCALAEPKLFLNKFSKILGLKTIKNGSPSPPPNKTIGLPEVVAAQIVAQIPGLSKLVMELEANSLPMGERPSISISDCWAAFDGYQSTLSSIGKLKEENAQLRSNLQAAEKDLTVKFKGFTKQLSLLERKNANAVEKIKKLSSQIHRLEEESACCKSDFQTAKKQISIIESSKNDVAKENEILNLQLNQFQEEMEHYFLQNQILVKEIDLLRKTTTTSYTDEIGPVKHTSTTVTLDDHNPATVTVNDNNPATQSLGLVSFGKLVLGKSNRKCIRDLFSPDWYQIFAGKQWDPLLHYLVSGWKKQLSPHPLFDPKFYAENNGLQKLKFSPLLHFIEAGYKLGYSPHPLFDIRWYWSQYPDVKESGMNPVIHYLTDGVSEGRNPSKSFDTSWYLEEYPDVKECGTNPLVHYVRFGKKEGRIKSPAI